MRQARFLHGGLLLLLAGSAGSAGCTQYHYYGAVPACAPGTVQYGSGSVCEVPAPSGGAAVAQNGTRSSAVGSTPAVVVSQPSGSSPRLSWRRSDPEASIATTRVEGAIDDTTTTR